MNYNLKLKPDYKAIVMYDDGYRGHQELFEVKDEIEIKAWKKISNKICGTIKDVSIFVVDKDTDFVGEWYGLYNLDDDELEEFKATSLVKYFEVIEVIIE